jgi:hypothetical protein
MFYSTGAETCPRAEHLKNASLSEAPSLPGNIRLGLKRLKKTNTLAYFEYL